MCVYAKYPDALTEKPNSNGNRTKRNGTTEIPSNAWCLRRSIFFHILPVPEALHKPNQVSQAVLFYPFLFILICSFQQFIHIIIIILLICISHIFYDILLWCFELGGYFWYVSFFFFYFFLLCQLYQYVYEKGKICKHKCVTFFHWMGSIRMAFVVAIRVLYKGVMGKRGSGGRGGEAVIVNWVCPIERSLAWNALWPQIVPSWALYTFQRHFYLHPMTTMLLLLFNTKGYLGMPLDECEKIGHRSRVHTRQKRIQCGVDDDDNCFFCRWKKC